MSYFKEFILYIILIFKFLSGIVSLTPYSECTQGRVTGYDEYTEGGSCGFGVPTMYGAAPNYLFYNLGEKCGICYEMVGPMGVLFFMVDSHCPGGHGGVCGGDMLHFDLHRNGYKTIFDTSAGTFNVTFRMVSCDHKKSISGEKVQTTINEIIEDHEYDTGVQFTVPNKYYEPFSLKEIESPRKENCCKLNDAFTDIYYEGKYLGEWQDVSGCERDSEYTKDCYEGSKCVRVDLKDWKSYQFFNRIKPETRRYTAIKFAIKSENECDNCLKLKLDDNEFIYLSTKEAGKWEEKIVKLEELGLNNTSERFRKFIFQGRREPSQIFYFDSIKLIKSSFVDQGSCYANTNTLQDNNLNEENKNQASTITKSIKILTLSLLILLPFLIYN
ncbi:hypothetical protein PIROE2DRAFT_61607 [Piromyces sp. E2]|nr:hypothetical protein PIROE2DRAFT_61607 [Piromyces sp. E2]|eukprot:OUM62858.1 hypothetical protein PIROE2DRAFT_61607 [Piromyces sp. E2]